MEVDVTTVIEIARSRHHVAAFAADPANATRWYGNIASAELGTPEPLGAGSRIAFRANALGRQLGYTYEVVEYVPDERLVMRTVDGPYVMETTYTWEDCGAGRARMTLRNRGRPSGLASVMAPLMKLAMRRANRKDLRRLKSALEREADSGAADPDDQPSG
jgi:catechol 2,3-dioxygenase-like lactoylglutathione lyase family enzyme